MILKYGGNNYFCFKEDFEIDLRLTKNCPEDISYGRDCSKIMCIKGANGAGKTNALKALPFIASFITSSFNSKPDKQLEFSTFFSNELPSHFYCEFRIANNDYRYDLTIEKHTVIEEKLVLISDSSTPLFHRKGKEELILSTSYSKLGNIPQLRANASIISTANQHEIECISDIYDMFSFLQTNVYRHGFNEDFSPNGLSRFYHNRPSVLSFVVDQLKRFDTGIVNIKIETSEDKDGDTIYFPVFYFQVEGELKTLRLNHQSTGTKRLYSLLGQFFIVLANNTDYPFSSIMVLDELDLHLHGFIIHELINFFEEEENVQLIFTCQNDQILDTMGKYRTTLINKEENESYSYRLNDLPSDLLRNHRPITPHYNKGSLGGVPSIDK